MIPIKGLYESLISEYVSNIRNKENFVIYNEMKLFIKKYPHLFLNHKSIVIVLYA
jgi:hypothetical protein